jgi:hypothetical protein
VDWFVKLSKDGLSLHPVRFPTFVNHPSPHPRSGET